jgi:hypothetical protein
MVGKVWVGIQVATDSYVGKTRGSVEIGFDVISLWWFGHRAIVDIMENTCVNVIPEIITLTTTCSDSDISTMGGNGNDDDDSDDNSDSASDDSSDDIEGKSMREMQEKIRQLQNKERKRKQKMTDLQEQLKDTKQARIGKLLGKRKETKIKNLAAANTLPIDKQISLNNYFRDVVFRSLKLVTKEVLDSGFVVDKIMRHLQLVTEYDKKMYRVHIELALQKQVGQYRNNSVKNIKWKYRTKKGKGPGT